MVIDDFLRVFCDSIPDLDPAKVGPDTVFRDLPQWDSLAVLVTLATIDAEYEVSMSAEELVGCQTIQALFEKVKEKKGQ